jgi:SAM-dependent methyltransferase
MASIKDDSGYNQGYKPSKTLEIRNERRCDQMISRMDVREGLKILEMGCGTGEYSSLLGRKTNGEVLGIDICDRFVDVARKRYSAPNVRFEVVDIRKPERILAEKFDVVVGNGILHHVYYIINDVLKNIRSVLRKGGKIIFLEPNIWNPYCFLIFNFPVFGRMASLDPDEKAFGSGFIKRKLRENGYTDIQIDYRDFLLPCTPLRWVSAIVGLGEILERMPVLNRMAQSIFISARSGNG